MVQSNVIEILTLASTTHFNFRQFRSRAMIHPAVQDYFSDCQSYLFDDENASLRLLVMASN